MTAMNETTTEMQAGRELDALVAEKVMGWEKLTVGYIGGADETPRQRELRKWMRRVGLDEIGDYFIHVPTNSWVEVDDWHPSSDIAAAWQVVEKMREREWRVCWSAYDKQWNVEEEDGGYPSVSGLFSIPEYTSIAHADTAPLAICRAALAAVEAR